MPALEGVNVHSAGPPTRYLTMEDASQLVGLTDQRLRQLARKGELKWRGSMKDPLFALSGLLALAAATVPKFPEWLLQDELPEARKGRGRPSKKPVFKLDELVRANVLDVLPVIPKASVSSVVCSPPYWGQRVYRDEKPVGWADGSLVAFGREETPEAYVAHTLQILKGLLRVLTVDGTIWWNIADSYNTRTIARTSSSDRIQHYAGKTTRWADNPYRRTSHGHNYLKDKDLSLVPFQIAIGAQQLGYWLRSVIVWSKQQAIDDFHEVEAEIPGINGDTSQRRMDASGVHMPEVVRDRPVTAHEYILLLTKSDRYEYDYRRLRNGTLLSALNVRTVWTFPPAVWQGNHGARYPDELPRRCILLGSEEDDLIFDPFAGQGTTLTQAKALGRHYFGCDISRTYVSEARARLKGTVREPPRPEQPPLPVLTEVTPTSRGRGSRSTAEVVASTTTSLGHGFGSATAIRPTLE